MNTINELNKEKNTITRLIITSDPQYPWTPAMDDGNSKESENEKKRVSENLIREQYNNINSYVSSHGVAPVIINGDITAYGHPWQREKMEELFNELLMRHFYGLGNHDIENNFNNCVDNRCTAGSLSDLYWHTRRMPETILDEVDIKKSDLPFGKTALTGSFAYAINHQDFYIIQLNNYPTMEIESKPVFGDHFKMQSTLDWLEKVLKKARALGKIIIVNVHKPDCWTVKPKCKDEKPSQRFKDLLKKYDVSAVFAGHYHKKLGLRGEFSEYFGNIPVFLSGSASQKSYLIVEQTEENLNVYSVQENNWRGKKLEKSIKLNLPIKGTYKIKTALNNTRSGVDVSVNRNPDGDRNVHLYKDNDTKRHQWDFYYDSVRNAYQIHSVEERSKVLAWNDFNKSKNVFLTNNKKLDEHYWFLEDIGNDYYIIKNYKDSSLVLEVEGGKTDDNTNIHVNIRRETNAQKFKLKPAIIQGTYKIKTALNGTSGVDVSVNRNPDGDRNVHLYKDNDTKRHQWDFYYDSIRNAYQIHNVEERSKVLAWNDFNKSKNVFLTNNKKLDEHYWFLEDIGNDYYIIKNYKDSSLVLEVEGGKTDDNTNIHVNIRRETNAQKFKLKPAIIQGTYKIKTALNGTSGVDVSVNRNPDGDRNVHLYKDNDTKRHQWDFYYDSIRNAYQIHNVEERSKVLAWNDFNKSKNVFLTNNKKLDEHYWFIEDIGNDYYIIKNYKDSSLVLEVEGGKTGDNTNIHVNKRSEANAQKFKLVKIESKSFYYQQDLSEQESENTLLLNS